MGLKGLRCKQNTLNPLSPLNHLNKLNFSKKMNRSFQLLTISIFLILILPWLIQDGMFMDGMIYATVARNLSLGIGSWWQLHLTNFISPQYFDQPPLTIWITSFFFKLFGYSMYTERIYSFTTALINLILIKVLWQKVNRNNPEYKDHWWLPVLLWIIPPACFWSFTNNMEENTMSIFILSSVYFMFDVIQRNSKKAIPLLLMSICILLAAMCKGIQGTFTLIGFLSFAIAIDRFYFKTAIKHSIILGIALTTLGFCLYQYTPTRDYFIGYYHTRILNTFTNPATATTNTRFYLLFRLLSEQITPILICITILALSVKNKLTINTIAKNGNLKYALLFLLIALAGTLPLLITAEQRRFYLVPTFPFYALALSFLVIEQLTKLLDKLKSTKFQSLVRLTSFAIFIVTIILTITNFGTSKRDKEMLSDIYKIGKFVPENTSIAIDKELFRTWVLHLYFQRYYGISLDATDENRNQIYYVSKKKDSTLSNYSEIDLELNVYKLYKKQ